MSKVTQLFPPCPKFTDQDVPDQTGKVHIVTGGASGIGFELVRILYQKNAIIYIAARSADKIKRAINDIQRQSQSSTGKLETLLLDLSDLATIKPAVTDFLSKEQRVDILFHNAGVMATPVDSKSAQNHELQMATNALGPYLLTKLLEPLLLQTAKKSPEGAIRIVWVASMMALGTPEGGVVWDSTADQPSLLTDSFANYMQSKAGVVFLAHEYAKKLKEGGIISLSLHPGMLKTELQRHMPAPVRGVMGVVFKGPVYGAYTELFAGFSPDIKSEDSGRYLIPWGRFGPVPEHMAGAMKSKEQGGTGVSETFYQWCDNVTNIYQ